MLLLEDLILTNWTPLGRERNHPGRSAFAVVASPRRVSHVERLPLWDTIDLNGELLGQYTLGLKVVPPFHVLGKARAVCPTYLPMVPPRFVNGADSNIPARLIRVLQILQVITSAALGLTGIRGEKRVYPNDDEDSDEKKGKPDAGTT
ncbi:MAG: hypothetical protein ABFE08_09875 [Armatimonadia bacterium]